MNEWLRWAHRGAVLGLSALVWTACTSRSSGKKNADDCDKGSEGCGCYGNGTCDDGLECLSKRCVDAEGDASASGGSKPTGGKSNQSADGDGGQSKPGSGTSGDDAGDGKTGKPSGSTDGGGPGSSSSEDGPTTASPSMSETDSGTSSDPTSPSQPMTPVEPTGPDGPTGPASTTPVGPTGPGVPTTPVTPTTPTGPTQPSSGWSNCPNNPDGCVVDTATRCDVEATSLWIDDFATCDASICTLGGRIGKWFSYAGSGIGLDADQRGVMVPPSDWNDPNCGMLLAGGAKAAGGELYAGVGFALNDGDPYDISSYDGVYFALGTESALTFTIRNSSDEYFIYPSSFGGESATTEHYVPLSAIEARSDNPDAVLYLDDVVEFQWNVNAPDDGFGFVIHGVWFD